MISTETNRTAELTTDGAETEFDFAFLIHADTEIQVWYQATGGDYIQLTLDTNYTIVFTESGGTVTTIGDDSPYAAGKILIIRHLAITQQTNWLFNDNHTGPQHEDDFDRAVMRDLQIQEQLNRAVGFNITSETTGIEFPEPVADKVIGWNSTGTELENKTPESTISSGIADGNFLVVDGDPNSGEYARFTANGLEGRTEAEFKGDFNLEIGTDVQAWDTQLDDIAALSVTDSNFIVGDGFNWIVESGNTARTSLGLGTGDSPTFAGATLTNAAVIGSDSVVFQPNTDSTTFFQIKNAAGAIVGNFDTTNIRFGIGTGSPGETLEVAGNIAVTGKAGDDVYIFKDAGSGIRIRSDSLTTQWWAGDNGPAYFGTVSNDDLHIQTNNNNRITIKSGAGSGYVGIGTTDPDTKLEVFNAGTQLKLSYDASNYFTFATQNDGDLTLDSNKVSYNLDFGDGNLTTTGTGTFTGLTVTGNSVFGLNSSVFQPNSDSTTFFQVLDADGGTPIFNVDTTNERVGIGTTDPNATFHIVGTGASGKAPVVKMTNVNNHNWHFGVWKTEDKFTFARSGVADVFLINNTTKIISFNEGGLNWDLRIKSNNDDNAFYLLGNNGYIGIGEVAPETLTEWTSTAPYLTLHNSTHEDSDGGRESRINFKGEQSGGEETTLARIEIGHDGAADDEKGKVVISTNAGSDTNTPTNQFKIQSTGDWVINKTSGVGIKVDLSTPTFGWRDLLGQPTALNTGASKPTFTTYRDTLLQFQFAAGDEEYFEFHIPHDYVAGTDIHLHIHWSHIGTFVTGGTVTFEYEISYAKGHNQAAFPASVGTTFNGTASTTQYQQIITETQISAASPDANQIDSDDLEPDGIIIARFDLNSNDITVSEGAVPDPFIHYVDIHYQSTNIGTKDKVPDFYT